MRLQAPEATHTTFLGAPLVTDVTRLAADFAVIGVPFGVPYGMRQVHYGPADSPRAVRERSFRFGRMLDHYDFDFGCAFSDLGLRVVDCGDVAGNVRDIEANARDAVAAIRELSERGAVPIVLGGDDSVSALAIRALESRGPVTVVQIDAHIDYRDEVNGERQGYSSPMRRVSELGFVERVVHIGSRGVGSARAQDVADTLARGNAIVSVAAVRERGISQVLELLPAGGSYHVVLDCDGLDPAVMPGTSVPVPGGLGYDDVAALFRGLGERGRVAGFNLAEYYPALDVNGITALTAVRLIVNLMAGTRIGSRTQAPIHERARDRG
jgi:agmatinase